MPSVRVELRFVDAKGKPTRGSTTLLGGLLPDDPHPPGRFPVPTERRRKELLRRLQMAPERRISGSPPPGTFRTSPTTTDALSFMRPEGLKSAWVSLLHRG